MKTYACFMLILFLFSYLAPREDYRKYFDFFIGILMTAALIYPVLDFFSEDKADKLLENLKDTADKLESIEYEEKGEDIIERILREASQSKEE